MQTDKQSVIVDASGQPYSMTAPVREVGYRSTEDSRLRSLYNLMYADPELVAMIRDVELMDKKDGRVKKIHGRTSRAMTKSGLKLKNSDNNPRLAKVFKQFVTRLGLKNREKLASDARGLIKEGNLPLQWVLNGRSIESAIRMPVTTLKPNVGGNGQYLDVNRAWEQWDTLSGEKVAEFPLWQLTVGRLTPDNIDDMGSLGRPYLDASREVWKKLVMTEEDLVIRRRERAPLRTAHVLEGANEAELLKYEEKILNNQQDITTNYFANKKGAVTAVQGDANLDQIADVNYLLDTFFAGSPAPKGLFGYTGDLNRDILEDLKRDFFDELDALQDVLSWVYEQGFRLQLLLQGINPADYDFEIVFAERLTETPNMKADRAVKVMSVGASKTTVWETAGLDPEQERERLKSQEEQFEPYPQPTNIGIKPRIKVTEGNAKKGESATSVTN